MPSSIQSKNATRRVQSAWTTSWTFCMWKGCIFTTCRTFHMIYYLISSSATADRAFVNEESANRCNTFFASDVRTLSFCHALCHVIWKDLMVKDCRGWMIEDTPLNACKYREWKFEPSTCHSCNLSFFVLVMAFIALSVLSEFHMPAGETNYMIYILEKPNIIILRTLSDFLCVIHKYDNHVKQVFHMGCWTFDVRGF